MAARWSEEEEATLREIWRTPGLLKVQVDRLPRRNADTAQKHAEKLKLGRKAHFASPLLDRIKALMADNMPRPVREIALLAAGSELHTRDMLRAAVERKEFSIPKYAPSPVNGNFEALYKLGAGRNAKKPRARTSAERCREWRRKQDPIEREFRAKRYELNRRIKAGVRPDPLAAALFGSAAV